LGDETRDLGREPKRRPRGNREGGGVSGQGGFNVSLREGYVARGGGGPLEKGCEFELGRGGGTRDEGGKGSKEGAGKKKNGKGGSPGGNLEMRL